MPSSLNPDELRKIDQVCDEFEESWRAGEQPRLEIFVERVPDGLKEPLLDALLPLFRELLVSKSDPPPDLGQKAAIQPIAITRPISIDVPAPKSKSSTVEIAVQRPAGVVSLEVIEGPHRGQVFEFDKHATLVTGRSPAAQLKLEKDLHFSRHHFRLEINPPRCYLLDLDSRNGTWINGSRVNESFLKDGDVISGGKTHIRVRIQGERSGDLSGEQQVSKSALFNLVETNSTKIPGYEVLGLIGRGDLGATFRARHLSSQRQVAIKLVQPATDVDQSSLEAFVRDSNQLRELQHPRIVKLHHLVCVGEFLCFVYNLVPDLGCLASLEKMSLINRIRCACHWMYQVLGALNSGHANNVVHRDLKPSNVLVSRQNNKWTAMLSDYAIAKRFADAGLSAIARSGDFPGSLPYMAPELFIDSRNTEMSVDVYSAGATLYHWLSGTTPHEFSEKCQYLTILDHEPIPITNRQPLIPQTLSGIVHRALSRNPKDRFPTVAVMAKELRRFLEET